MILGYVLKRNYDLSPTMRQIRAVAIKKIRKSDFALRESRVQLRLKLRVYK